MKVTKAEVKDVRDHLELVKELIDNPDNNIMVIKAQLFSVINKLDRIIEPKKYKKVFECKQFGTNNSEDMIEIR